MTVLVDPQGLTLVLLVMARVSSLLVVAPVLSRSTVPRSLRVLLATSVTALLIPLLPPAPNDALVARLIGEVALGLALGLVVELLFAGVDLASSALSFGTGMSYINIVDPSSPVRATALMTLQWLFATLLFLAVDGHHLLLRALGHSFAVVPAGTVAVGGMSRAVVAASLNMFALGLALAGPALVIIALIDITLGLVGRVAPQIPALLIGMGLKPLAGFLAMATVYGAMPLAFRRAIDGLVENLGRVITAAS